MKALLLGRRVAALGPLAEALRERHHDVFAVNDPRADDAFGRFDIVVFGPEDHGRRDEMRNDQ